MVRRPSGPRGPTRNSGVAISLPGDAERVVWVEVPDAPAVGDGLSVELDRRGLRVLNVAALVQVGLHCVMSHSLGRLCRGG